MIRLYFTPNSPYARKVRIVLAEKGIEFKPEVPAVAPSGSGQFFPKSYEAMNPNLRIPLLEDNGLRLWESGLILDYLLKNYPKQTAKADPPFAGSLTRPERHWQDMLILNTIETLLDSGINVFQFIRGGLQPDQVPYLRREAERAQSELDWLETQITADGFWPGTFSALDSNLICTLAWLDLRNPVPWRGRPRLEAFMDRHGARPSVQTTRPPG
jgi:glutathione S-transferase